MSLSVMHILYCNKYNCVFSVIEMLECLKCVSPVSWVYRIQQRTAIEDHGARLLWLICAQSADKMLCLCSTNNKHLTNMMTHLFHPEFPPLFVFQLFGTVLRKTIAPFCFLRRILLGEEVTFTATIPSVILA